MQRSLREISCLSRSAYEWPKLTGANFQAGVKPIRQKQNRALVSMETKLSDETTRRHVEVFQAFGGLVRRRVRRLMRGGVEVDTVVVV